VRSSADIERVLASATAEIVAHARARAARAPVILIDGRSGAGKTTLAARVAGALDAHVLALDSVYPGWDGLAAGAEIVRRGVLEPRAHGRPGCWPRWDWTRDRVAEEREVPVDVPLVVEGAGVLTPASRMLSDVQVWVESPTGSRRERALDRDGDAYRPHWERWAAQEEAHIRAHDPASLAVIIVDVP